MPWSQWDRGQCQRAWGEVSHTVIYSPCYKHDHSSLAQFTPAPKVKTAKANRWLRIIWILNRNKWSDISFAWKIISVTSKMLLQESAGPLLFLLTFSSPLIGCHALLKRKLPSPQVRGSNMANKESTCEGGDVRWCAPEKENNGQFRITY